MIKTIATIPNWTPLDPALRDEVFNQMNVWIEENKYTGGFTSNFVGPEMIVTRQEWADQSAAEDYKNYAILKLSGLYPEFTVDIVVE